MIAAALLLVFTCSTWLLWRTGIWSWRSAHQGGIWSLAYPASICSFALGICSFLLAAICLLDLAFALFVTGSI